MPLICYAGCLVNKIEETTIRHIMSLYHQAAQAVFDARAHNNEHSMLEAEGVLKMADQRYLEFCRMRASDDRQTGGSI